MTAIFASVADAKWFHNFITAIILGAGVLVGVETYPSMVAEYGGILHFFDKVILWIFVAEVVVKMGAHGSKPWLYFNDPWNIFDFSIVAVCFMPVDASFVAVLRLARILRVLKLVTAIPKLQILVNALLKSIPSMGYVSLLLFMLFYIYACMAVTLFGANDPHHFGNLQISLLSLFRVVTLEDWTDLMYIAMYGCGSYGYDGMMDKCVASTASPVASVSYFVSFVLLGTMIILNLFIGVIMNGMDEARSDQADEDAGHSPGEELLKEARQLETQLKELQDRATMIRIKAEKVGGLQDVSARQRVSS